jgi:hypothetical protein
MRKLKTMGTLAARNRTQIPAVIKTRAQIRRNWASDTEALRITTSQTTLSIQSAPGEEQFVLLSVGGFPLIDGGD